MSGRLYQQYDYSKPYILRFDTRAEDTEIEELFERPPGNIAVPVKKIFDQAYYRTACLNGEEHPLAIEREHYMMITICKQSMDTDIFIQADGNPGYAHSNRFCPAEIDFINSIQRRPEIEWAVDNSFDGIYVQKYEDHHRMSTMFQFAVYMKEEQATFWKLKFHGR